MYHLLRLDYSDMPIPYTHSNLHQDAIFYDFPIDDMDKAMLLQNLRYHVLETMNPTENRNNDMH
jgi:hypothetical protein